MWDVIAQKAEDGRLRIFLNILTGLTGSTGFFFFASGRSKQSAIACGKKGSACFRLLIEELKG
jgi:hypothetical protein